MMSSNRVPASLRIAKRSQEFKDMERGDHKMHLYEYTNSDGHKSSISNVNLRYSILSSVVRLGGHVSIVMHLQARLNGPVIIVDIQIVCYLCVIFLVQRIEVIVLL